MRNRNKPDLDSIECAKILADVKTYANQVKKMHQEIKLMLEESRKLKSDVDVIQHEEVQQQMLRLASKAAKKAAKKSIAKAKIKEKLYPQNKDS